MRAIRSSVRAKWRILLCGAALGGAALGLPGQSSRAPALASGCTKDNFSVYHCGSEPFQSRLLGAHSVTIAAGSMDRYTSRELRHLVERLGKDVAQPGQMADLTFTVVPVSEGAVSMGPADRPLASLLVYAPNGQQGPGTLVWSETFSGQDDRPWPMVVRAVIEQFEGRLRATGGLARK